MNNYLKYCSYDFAQTNYNNEKPIWKILCIRLVKKQLILLSISQI